MLPRWVLAATADRRWLVLPAIVTGFFSSTPLGMLAAAADPASGGLPDRGGIKEEHYVLKALRGDFEAKVGDKLDAVLRSPAYQRGGA
ncbi:hypothetical protein HJA81_26965 [Rhizobium bangladeshense]|nr:hypothetical protein [Rhizobium bangladeshense]MBX4898834.1 hypothetical protein [Rhizobium bangladeshense]MBY3616868.1 hypothetical protein [Rhizobium bangladeshense]